MRSVFSSVSSLTWIGAHFVIFLVGVLFIVVSSRSQAPPQLDWVDTIGQSVGASLVAARIAGEALFLYVRASEDTRSRLEAIQKAGLTEIFAGRSVKIRNEYEKRLKDATEVDILGFGLGSFRQDYGVCFVEWSRTKKLRILLLDPSFPSIEQSYAKQRDAEEKNPEGHTIRDVKEFVSFVRTQQLNTEHFQVRLMRVLPSINLFRVDDELFWGPYLVEQQSRNTTTILVRRGGFMYTQFTQHFENIWSSDKYSQAIDIRSDA
jgi:hypothetical protein